MCCRWIAKIADLNPADGMEVRLEGLLCVASVNVYPPGVITCSDEASRVYVCVGV